MKYIEAQGTVGTYTSYALSGSTGLCIRGGPIYGLLRPSMWKRLSGGVTNRGFLGFVSGDDLN